MAAVYRPLCPLLNFFIPTQKLLGKTRVGPKIKKVYDKIALSPYQRLLTSPDLSVEVKIELTRRYKLYDPVVLQQEVHDAVERLMSLAMTKNLDDAVSLANAALQAV